MNRTLFICISLIGLYLSSSAQVGFVQEGMASYYGDEFEGKITASGERYSQRKATAAHVSIPFGALVRITNLENGKTAIVRINDRGPFVSGRIIDVTRSVAQRLDMVKKGLAKVRIEVIDSSSKLSVPQTGKFKASQRPPSARKSSKQGAKGKAHVSSGSPVVPVKGSGVKDGKFYNLFVTTKPLNGYGVQIGSFAELSNLLNLAARIGNKYGKGLAVKQSGSDRITYKLMVTGFRSRSEAEKFKQKNGAAFPGCFIVKF